MRCWTGLKGSAPSPSLQSTLRMPHLDVGDALKVGDQVLDEALPRLEAFDEDIRGSEFVRTWGGSDRVRGSPYSYSAHDPEVRRPSQTLPAVQKDEPATRPTSGRGDPTMPSRGHRCRFPPRSSSLPSIRGLTSVLLDELAVPGRHGALARDPSSDGPGALLLRVVVRLLVGAVVVMSRHRVVTL